MPKTINPSFWLPAIENEEKSVLNRDWTQSWNMYNLRVFAIFVSFYFMGDFFFKCHPNVKATMALGCRIRLGKTDIALFKPSLTGGRGGLRGV